MGVRLYSPSIGRFLQTDPEDGGNATAYDYCAGDPVNCTDLDGKWGWGSIKRGLSKVAKVASYASMIPGPIGTIAGVVSAISYAATGNWREAAWAAAGSLAAVVGAGAAVKGARWAVHGSKLLRRACRVNSFTGDTPVLMADGSYRPIAQVQQGDLVAVDPATGAVTAQPVIEQIVGSGTRHLIDLDLGDGEPLVATAGHPIWVEGKGWVDAAAVHSGDRVRTVEGDTRSVRSVTDRGWLAGQVVYNLNVVFGRGDLRQLNLGSEGWTAQAAERYAGEQCGGIGLDPTRPYDDLDFLRPLPGLRVLSLGAAKVKDMSAVFDKTDLEEFGGGLTLRDLRGLSRLTKLRVLAVPYRRGIEEIAGLTGLEQLQIEEWPKGADLDLLGPKPHLRSLWLTLKRTAEVSSSWFSAAPELTELSLYGGGLTDTAGLAAASALTEVHFAGTRVSDLGFAAALPRLRLLELDNAGDVRGPAPGAGVELRVIGKTRITD